MTELADTIGVDPPRMSKMINSLETKGIVSRVRDKDNRRRVRVWLTHKGKKARAHYYEQCHRNEKELFAHLDDTEKERLAAYVWAVCRLLEKAFEPEHGWAAGQACRNMREDYTGNSMKG